MPHPPIDDATRLRICELADDGLSVRAIASELGVAPSTVTRNARRLGLHFDRAAVEAATRARQADAKAKRAAAAIRSIDEAMAELDRLRRPCRLHSFGWRGTYTEHVVPQPPASERADIARVYAILIDRHIKLAEVDMGEETTDHAKTLLGRLMGQMNDLTAVDGWLESMTNGGQCPHCERQLGETTDDAR